jgi:hypothetical protein
MTIRNVVERNVVIWLLGTLVSGFIAGWTAYETILAVSGRKVVSEEEFQRLQIMPAAASRPACEDYGVTLVQRTQEVADAGQSVVVTGSLKPLPPGYRLWLAAVAPSESFEYWPRGEVKEDGRSWTLEVRPGLETPGERKRFAVFVVGPDGQVLIQQYFAAMKRVAADREWPPMTYMTSDMHSCPGRHEVFLK